MFSPKLRSIAILALVSCIACGDDDSGPTDVSLTLTVLDFVPTPPYPPVEGATVCLLGTEDCGVTDADGQAELQVPGESEISLTVTKEDYQAGLAVMTTEDGPLTREMTTLTLALTETLGVLLDTPVPPVGTGALSISAINTPTIDGMGGVPGITFTITSGDGKRFYFDGSLPSLDASETSLPIGSGGYVELSPGEYDVEVGGNVDGCEIWSGWEGSSDNVLRTPIELGHITYLYLLCESS
ncbi:MAG: hypothetical protein AAF997_06750 [Myxococcota bacterium]